MPNCFSSTTRLLLLLYDYCHCCYLPLRSSGLRKFACCLLFVGMPIGADVCPFPNPIPMMIGSSRMGFWA
uniref:Putative secreted protein n=1 Tax=Anopheles darlingi TaxID=43151 RepID=A0A2M4DEG3_ANODA